MHLQRELIVFPSRLIPATGTGKRPLVAEKGITRNLVFAPHLDFRGDEVKWRAVLAQRGIMLLSGGNLGMIWA